MKREKDRIEKNTTIKSWNQGRGRAEMMDECKVKVKKRRGKVKKKLRKRWG
jgi:hypothetical protein